MRRTRQLDDVGEIGLGIVSRLVAHELGAHDARVNLRQDVPVWLGILQDDRAQ